MHTHTHTYVTRCERKIPAASICLSEFERLDVVDLRGALSRQLLPPTSPASPVVVRAASSNSNYVAASKRFHTWRQPGSGSPERGRFCVLLSRGTNERDTFARNGIVALDPRQSHAWESDPRVRQPSWARRSRSSSGDACGGRVRNFSSSAERSPRYRSRRRRRRRVISQRPWRLLLFSFLSLTIEVDRRRD